MSYEEFIEALNNWRANNGFPNRTECREVFRECRDNGKKLDWCDYVLKQEKPAMFLDSLFAKGKDILQKASNPKEDILAECYEYIKTNNIVPTFADISNSNAKKIFETEENLFAELENKYQDLSAYILNENSFDKNYNEKVIKQLKKYDKYVITTAVSNKKVNTNFLNSLKGYCEKNNALLLIMPCADVASRKTSVKWQLDPVLKDFPIIYNDTFLNDNLMISDINVSAKQIHPISGLHHLCREKSVIIASTKQELEYIPALIGQFPHAIMTTGAITIGDYSTDAFMSKRTSKLAEHDHITGAIVVEKESDKIFHFRQLQADKQGRVCDLGVIYKPDFSHEFDENVCAVLGDLHSGEEDYGVLLQEKEVIEDLEIKKVVLHDIGSMRSIAHWDRNKTITQAIKYTTDNLSLEKEANNIANTLKIFEDLDEIYVVRSNHDKFLHRWIETGDYAKDPINLYYALDIVKAFLEGKNPFEFMIKQKTLFKDLKSKRNKFKFLQKNESKTINGAEISLHGDKGANGSKGNDKILNKTFASAVMAHTHSPKIFRGIYTVGTTSKKDLEYIDGGLSTWGHAMCLIHSNGSKQLVNIIKDKNGKLSWRKW